MPSEKPPREQGQKPPREQEQKPPREQEQSIKARKSELFEDPSATTGPVKPFPQYLDETSAAPLSKAEKAALWAAGVVAVLLFLAALATIRTQKKRIVYKSRTPAVVQPATPAETKAAVPEAAKTSSPAETKAAPSEKAKAVPSEKAKAPAPKAAAPKAPKAAPK